MSYDRDGHSPERDSSGRETKEERRQRRREKRERHEAKRRRHETRAEPGSASPSQKRLRQTEGPSAGLPPRPDEGGFVWKKKLEQQRRRGEPPDASDEAQRRVELAAELEAAKHRRAERDAERAAWEAEQARVAREREQQENAGWHRAEETFHGAQHFLRQAIRLRQSRPVQTDSLARNLRLDLLDVAPDEKDPVARLRELDLSSNELVSLMEEIEKELDYIPDFATDGDNSVFTRQVRISWWENLKVCVRGMLEASRELRGAVDGVHSSVHVELDSMLQGKSLEKLLEMESEISKRVEESDDGEAGPVDEFAEIDFWTSALLRIRRVIAEERIKDLNHRLLEERRKRVAARPAEEKPSSGDELQGTGRATSTELGMMGREAAKGMRPDEDKFADEVETVTKRYAPAGGYAWNDKYRPRKPRYYNRVHTGYDWTKYNRTHYDSDNPPPKTVQGYRFNIFYPDLIDPSKTPTFVITKTENPEVCIITFKAGPPYEDLAFKIVNRPWERSHRRGFRCSFDRGILHMWFNFQRYRYRR